MNPLQTGTDRRRATRRRRRGRRISAVLAGAVLVAATGVAATVYANTAAPPHDRTSPREAARVDRVDPRLTWKPCHEIAECATATVPLDYDEPDGPATHLAVLRVKATDPQRRIGSLFVNPGGPGGPSTRMALALPALVGKEIRARFDIIGVDPRGIGESDNVRCWPSAAEQRAALSGLDIAFPVGAAEEKAYLAAAAGVSRACSTTGAPLSGAMSTAEVARDMDVIRRAVGDTALTFLGRSYGTALGQYYANMFPDRVRAIALDGVIDPVAWSGAAGGTTRVIDERMRSADGAARALREVLTRCDEAGEQRCVFAAGDPVRNWEKIAADLRREPLKVEDEQGTHTITYADFVGGVVGELYSTSAGAQITEEAAELQALLKDRSDATARRAVTTRIAAARAARDDEEPRYENSREMRYAVTCTDETAPDRPAEWIAAARRSERRVPHFGPHRSWYDAPCAGDRWTAEDEDAYRGPFDRRTAKPLLYLGNYWDPATSYESARSASARMPGARLLSSDNWGHLAYLDSPCTTDAIDAYLLTGALPAPGTVCTGSKQPFTEPLTTAPERPEPAADRLQVEEDMPRSVLLGNR